MSVRVPSAGFWRLNTARQKRGEKDHENSARLIGVDAAAGARIEESREMNCRNVMIERGREGKLRAAPVGSCQHKDRE